MKGYLGDERPRLPDMYRMRPHDVAGGPTVLGNGGRNRVTVSRPENKDMDATRESSL
jgi:hypothetical protein